MPYSVFIDHLISSPPGLTTVPLYATVHTSVYVSWPLSILRILVTCRQTGDCRMILGGASEGRKSSLQLCDKLWRMHGVFDNHHSDVIRWGGAQYMQHARRWLHQGRIRTGQEPRLLPQVGEGHQHGYLGTDNFTDQHDGQERDVWCIAVGAGRWHTRTPLYGRLASMPSRIHHRGTARIGVDAQNA